MMPPGAKALTPTDVSMLQCIGCGVYDPSLCYASHPTILSFVVGATDRSHVGLRCARCRAIESAKATAISLVTGWWSPRGPQLTIAGIRANLKGGAQQTASTAQLLRGIARFEYENENPELAAMFARAAQVVQPQIENRRFLEGLEREGHRIPFPDSPWRFAPFGPVVLFVVVFVLGLLALGKRATHDKEVPEAAARVAPAQRHPTSVRPKPKELITWDPYSSADTLDKLLKADSPPDLARLFLKKRLQEAQTDIPAIVRRGDNLASVEASISALGSRPGLGPLLADAPLKDPYQNLLAALRESNRRFRGGAPVEVIERDAGVLLNDIPAIPFSDISVDSTDEDRARDPQLSAEDRDAAAKSALKRDLQIRSTVIGTTLAAIDQLLHWLPA